MYAQIVIKSSDEIHQFGAKNHNTIYEYMLLKGCSHDVAADVADWAEIASVDEEYELDGFEIYIAE